MPEGPEIRRAAEELDRALAGKPLTRIEYRVPRLAGKARKLRGARITRVYSRGKALLIEFDNGLTHYSHNQLFGEWEVVAGPPAHDDRRAVRVVLATRTHTATLFSATEIDILPTPDVARHPYIAKLGPDALDASTTPAIVRERLLDREFRNRTLSSLLLDQHFVAGLGNYLRSDILFAAGLPANARPAQLDATQLKRLAAAIPRTTRRFFRNERARFLAYGREGEPCRTCGTAIERTEAGNRGLFHCPACQPALRRARPRLHR